MSTEARASNPGDGVLDLLRREYEVGVPAPVADALDRRLDTAISGAVSRNIGIGDIERRRRRRRIVAALAIAAVLATAGATPVIQFFQGWGEKFDRVFARSTVIDQSVVDDGYRVSLVRAYADPSSVRLAFAAEDLRNRGWAEMAVGSPTLTDGSGHVFPMTSGQYRAPTRDSSEGWLRFNVPAADAVPGVQHLHATIDRLGVRPNPAPTLANGEVDLDKVWTSVAGRWSFDFDLAFLAANSARPGVAATVNGVTVTWEELTVTPGATVGRLVFKGLREVQTGWDPYFRVERNGQPLDLEMLSPGSVYDRLLFEGVPGFDDLSGTWVITIDQFHRNIPNPSSDITTEEESIVGPWVLRFNAP